MRTFDPHLRQYVIGFHKCAKSIEQFRHATNVMDDGQADRPHYREMCSNRSNLYTASAIPPNWCVKLMPSSRSKTDGRSY